MFLGKYIDEREVYEGIFKLDSIYSKGPGTDVIDTKILKSVADIVSPHIKDLFNYSLAEGTYPHIFKTARCVPVYKGSRLDPDKPVSYQPILILKFGINKTFERLLYTWSTLQTPMRQ